MQPAGTERSKKHLPTFSLRQQLHSWWNGATFIWRNHFSPLALAAEQRTYNEAAEVADTPIGELWADRGQIWEYLTQLEAYYLQGSAVLRHCKQHASRLRYMETLSIAHQLDTLLTDTPEHLLANHIPLQWLDVGAKNWAYVAALAHHASHLAGNSHYQLTGVELDARRLYADGHTRASYAASYTTGLSATYHHASVAKHQHPYHVISWILPFVVADPCLLWGLPLSEFNPGALWQHVVSLLEPSGVLLVINQGENEAETQQQLIASTPHLHIGWQGWLPETFLPYEHRRYGWRLERQQA